MSQRVKPSGQSTWFGVEGLREKKRARERKQESKREEALALSQPMSERVKPSGQSTWMRV